MAENIETEIGVFADETAALRAVRRLEADGIAPERVGVINDPPPTPVNPTMTPTTSPTTGYKDCKCNGHLKSLFD